MSNLYFDSSALVKYYLVEVGTPWVRSILDAHNGRDWEHDVSTSILTIAEVVSAFTRRRRAKQISATLCVAIISRFLREGRHRCHPLGVNELIVDVATELLQRHPLRAYDAVQLATALRLDRVLRENCLSPVTFVSADGLLCDVARAEGLAAVNPNDVDQ